MVSQLTKKENLNLIAQKHRKNSELSGPQSKNVKTLYYIHCDLYKDE